ncbi:hypothetical protein LZ32DRAFT_652629 [Colletotrichum eremochloae]|nr:hypothetical protein LZ32DRAFT_652629 [Colletotrichum eremochloae]
MPSNGASPTDLTPLNPIKSVEPTPTQSGPAQGTPAPSGTVGSGEDDGESDSGNGSGAGSGSRSGGSTSASQPTAQPQLGSGDGTTSVRPPGPVITLPSSLMTSMVLATAANAVAPTGGLFAVTTAPTVFDPTSAGCRTTQSGHVAALLSALLAAAAVALL